MSKRGKKGRINTNNPFQSVFLQLQINYSYCQNYGQILILDLLSNLNFRLAVKSYRQVFPVSFSVIAVY